MTMDSVLVSDIGTLKWRRDKGAIFRGPVFCNERVSLVRPLCMQCERIYAKLCAHCFMGRYCSRECQVQHWPMHRYSCKLKLPPAPEPEPEPEAE